MSGRPWRPFRWHHGQQHYSGTYWCATTAGHVVYESRLELARLIRADFDPLTVAIAAQPFLIEAEAVDHARRHVPDFLLLDTDGLAKGGSSTGYADVLGRRSAASMSRTRMRLDADRHRPALPTEDRADGFRRDAGDVVSRDCSSWPPQPIGYDQVIAHVQAIRLLIYAESLHRRRPR